MTRSVTTESNNGRGGDEEGWPTTGAGATKEGLAMVEGRRGRGGLGCDRGSWEEKEAVVSGGWRSELASIWRSYIPVFQIQMEKMKQVKRPPL
ncbi:hypothetical protein GW17_00027625 [Ensete ventricosum]|nr:hypothetical protein GW17_00027625 [Ensete ventricosum]RZR85454.1 hypothetical protein BHM03_00012442 [Ensete ventricosum]